MSVDFSLTREEKNTLGSIALNAVSLRLRGEFPPEPELSRYSPTLRKNLGCFVTLKEKGRLRGCIGTIVGESPLVRNVWRMAQLAAFDDPRFPPVSPSEWDELPWKSLFLASFLCAQIRNGLSLAGMALFSRLMAAPVFFCLRCPWSSTGICPPILRTSVTRPACLTAAGRLREPACTGTRGWPSPWTGRLPFFSILKTPACVYCCMQEFLLPEVYPARRKASPFREGI